MLTTIGKLTQRGSNKFESESQVAMLCQLDIKCYRKTNNFYDFDYSFLCCMLGKNLKVTIQPI